MPAMANAVAEIRRFHRVYLPYFHLLSQKYLNSDYSMAEARVLYEIYQHREISARDMVASLHIDKGYLSKMLKKLEAKALVRKHPAREDARRDVLSLTEGGARLAERLMEESNRQIEKELEGIPEQELDLLTNHLNALIDILEGNRHAADPI